MEETHKNFHLRVTEDKMAVLLDCDVITDELDSLVIDISNEFETLGIKEPPDKEQLKEQLYHAVAENPHLVDFVLIKGKPPVPPQHGRVNWAGDFFNTGFVKDKKTGKINYREKAAHESVKKGALLGRQNPVKEGEDGQDAFGESIPAEKPIEYYPKVGGNVRFNKNENAYYADVNGRVRLVNDTLYVDNVYTIQEDVDITTGNISHTGAVVVNKDVLKGAKVEAIGNIEVHGVVESAEIRTSGNLTVHGGIMQSDDQRIVVEGSINAKFIHGGDIQANKDIVVEKEIINSTVKTLGSVIISRGRVVGGEIVALRGIFVRQSGTRAYTPTVLVAGKNFSVKNKISLKNIKIKRIGEELAKLKCFIDTFTANPESTSMHSQEEYTKKQVKISELEQELQNLIKEVENIKSKAMSRAKKLIVVEEMLYPKTTLCLEDERLTIEKESPGPIRAKIVKGKIELC